MRVNPEMLNKLYQTDGLDLHFNVDIIGARLCVHFI